MKKEWMYSISTGIFILFILFCVMWILKPFEKISNGEVIVYVAHDQDYSEPILKKFEKTTGIKVKAVYDTEATKTVGLVNRLIAEKNNPQADVFWNNEVSRTIFLKKSGVLIPYKSPNSEDKPEIYKDKEGYWTGFAARARVIIYNTRLVRREEAPMSIFDLTDEKWRGKVGIANPLFGTTGSHVAALFALLGKGEAENFFKKLKKNDIKVVESNGMVRDQVVAGDLYIGLTDTDDANDAIVKGKNVAMVFPDQGNNEIGTLIIPNSVMLIKGSRNKENGKKLIDYLLSKEVEQMLSESKAMQMPLGKNVPHPKHVPNISDIKGMNIASDGIYDNLNYSQKFIRALLLT
jgi:iron(III) transport system substrate-binding protein